MRPACAIDNFAYDALADTHLSSDCTLCDSCPDHHSDFAHEFVSQLRTSSTSAARNAFGMESGTIPVTPLIPIAVPFRSITIVIERRPQLKVTRIHAWRVVAIVPNKKLTGIFSGDYQPQDAGSAQIDNSTVSPHVEMRISILGVLVVKSSGPKPAFVRTALVDLGPETRNLFFGKSRKRPMLDFSHRDPSTDRLGQGCRGASTPRRPVPVFTTFSFGGAL